MNCCATSSNASIPDRNRRPRIRRAPFVTALLVLLLGAACAVQPPVVVTEAQRNARFDAHRARLGTLETWKLTGRIAVQVDADAWSATLRWEQRGDEYALRVIAPLGQGTFELSGSPGGVALRTAENQVLLADDPEVLLEENLGWSLPLSGLFYWIRGLPAPRTEPESLLLDEQGRIEGMNQDGWRLEYQRYLDNGGLDLPAKLSLSSERLRVRLVIRDWDLAP